MSQDALVGTWQLQSFSVEGADGEVSHPFGLDPLGALTYTADGRMAVQFGRRDRLPVPNASWGANPDAPLANVARDYFAYCGTYEVIGDCVHHHVALSLMPNWIGTTVVRRFVLNGNTVILTTPPMPIDERAQVATLVWARADS
jgi:hypothetical protein